MRYAIISDIHANLEALQAVLAEIDRLRVDAFYCLGDLVGYNANPNECIAIIREHGIRSVMGNHDSRAAGLEHADDFNPYAADAIRWTRERLSPENTAFLRDLPRELQIGDLMLFHGSLHDTDRYILYRKDILDNFLLLRQVPGSPRLGLYGHTHVPMAVSLAGETPHLEEESVVMLQEERSYLINPGSVGQPRDGDPRAAFCVYDGAERTVTFHRVRYDVLSCQAKVIRAGLPQRLAERLAMGR